LPEVIFEINRDLTVPMADQAVPGHNRWHPDIPPAATVAPGATYRIECKDWTDDQVRNSDDADDIRDMNIDPCHVLSGPFAIEGAEPGDMLVVDIVNIGPFEEQSWGYTGIFAKENGGGFLTDFSPQASKAIWDLDGIWTSSRHVPGVRFIGNSHPGLFGCAPSPDLLAEWNRREQALIDQNPDRVTGDIPAHGGETPGAPQVPGLALPPLPKDALLGRLSGADLERAAAEACRTIPPREHGGNVDIKDLGVGSRVYMPVFVPGGLFSIGDLHFAQGDGEITFCGAIEMPGFIDLHFDLIKGGMDRYKQSMPFFKPGRVGPNYSEFLTFEGISVEDGRNYYMNATVAYRQACLNAINYLMPAMDWTFEQAYLFLGAAPIDGRIGGVVDIPNSAVSISIPLSIFDRNILPDDAGGGRELLAD
jgi:formamidase